MQTYNLIIDKNKRDTTAHGTPEFPLAVYTTIINRNLLGFIDWHWHNEIQFSLVTQGTVEFHIGSNTEILTTGEGIFINSTVLHYAKNYNNTDGTYICLDFHPLLLLHSHSSIIDNQYFSPFIGEKNIPYCKLSVKEVWSKTILDRIMHIKEIYYRNELDSSQKLDYLAVYMDLICIWHALYDNFFSKKDIIPQGTQDDTVFSIIKYISDHYDEKITLDDISSHVNASIGSCSRKFKTHMNCSIFEYIMHYRLEKSEALLLNTNMPITEIALNCGFTSSSYYIKHFRETCGISPAVYRKKQK